MSDENMINIIRRVHELEKSVEILTNRIDELSPTPKVSIYQEAMDKLSLVELGESKEIEFEKLESAQSTVPRNMAKKGMVFRTIKNEAKGSLIFLRIK